MTGILIRERKGRFDIKRDTEERRPCKDRVKMCSTKTHKKIQKDISPMFIYNIIICYWKSRKLYKHQALRDLSKIHYIYLLEYYTDVKNVNRSICTDIIRSQ